VATIELIVWLPEVALPPDQAPVALQFEALLEDQASSVEPPVATVSGATLSETAGAGDGAGGDPGGGVLAEVAGTLSPPPQPASAKASAGTSSRVFMRGMGKLIVSGASGTKRFHRKSGHRQPLPILARRETC
jgi:hypothetical protein